MKANEVAAVVLAASRDRSTWGTRRFLLPICGATSLDRVRRALADAGFSDLILATDAPGELASSATWADVVGLDEMAKAVGDRPTLLVSGDLPLVTAGALRAFWSAFSRGNGRTLVAAPWALAAYRSGAEAASDVAQAVFSVDSAPCPPDAEAWRPIDADDLRRLSSPNDFPAILDLARQRVLVELGEAGVLFVDPERTYVDLGVEIAAGTMIYPGTHIVGASRVGSGCRIGPDAWIESSVVEDGVQIRYSVLEEARVREGSAIGPFAHLRHGSDVGPDARIGNFVEVKASRLGRCVKAGHLSYLGDAEVGDGTNVGAGTITCNYDGVAKHRTVIEDGVFIGSNTSLVAPVTIGRGAVIGAGSTITEDVPPGKLAIARARQIVKDRRAGKSGEDT